MIHFYMALIDGIDKSHSGMQKTISSKHQKTSAIREAPYKTKQFLPSQT